MSQYNKLEVNVYSLDSLYKRDQDREAAQRILDAASDDMSMEGTAGSDTSSEEGPGTPRNQVMKPSHGLGSPYKSPYWFMENCPTGTIYCATDKDCGAACGPGLFCKLSQIVSNAVITGIKIAHELGSCIPSSVL